jgi:ABC-type nitrate/sulfonate/bicarbonate transport system ATPase subunit
LGTPREPVANGMISVDIRRMAYGATEILRDIRFELAEGENLATLGPSGIGKTTLLRIVAGLIKGFEGEISGAVPLAMVFQEPILLPWRDALRNLTLTTGITLPEAQAALDEVGLADKGNHFPGQLSLGQQRRLSLARAFAAKPRLLLLDEPFASLDEATAASMIALTSRMLAGRNIASLLVTHAAEEAVALASRALLMAGRPGTIVGEYRIDARPGEPKAEAAQGLRRALAKAAS